MSTAVARTIETYSVPRKFSLRTVLTVMGLFALLLAVVRWWNQPPAIPIFYTIFLALIAVAQMAFERSPRIASVLTGVVYLPICFVLVPTVRVHFQFSRFGENLVMLAIAGGFLAYLGGTLAAGTFLVCDLVRHLVRRSRPSTSIRVP